MEKKYKLIIICSALIMIIISLILLDKSLDFSNKGHDVINVAIDRYNQYAKENIDPKYTEEKAKFMKNQLSDVYPYGEYAGLGEGIIFILIIFSHILDYIFIIILIVLFATSTCRICRIILFILLFISLFLTCFLSIIFITTYKNKVNMNDDELYVFDDELNKELKEVIDDLLDRLLCYIFSIVCVFLGVIGYVIVFIFHLKDQD